MFEKESKARIKRNEIMTLVFLFLVTIIFILLFVVENNSNNSVKETETKNYAKGKLNEITYSIDGTTSTAQGDVLSGWCIRQSDYKEYYNYGIDEKFNGVINNYTIALKRNDKLFIIPTKLNKREDVNNQMNGVECGYCGFVAMIPEKYKQLSNGCSVVFLMKDEEPKGKMTLYDTGVKAGQDNE